MRGHLGRKRAKRAVKRRRREEEERISREMCCMGWEDVREIEKREKQEIAMSEVAISMVVSAETADVLFTAVESCEEWSK